MTRSIYLSRSRSEATTSLVVSSCIAALGTAVEMSASEIVSEIAMKDSVDSLPPASYQSSRFGK